MADCAVCQRARANFLPYPARVQKPLPRSFGYTDELSEEKLRVPGRGDNRFASGSDAEFNLSLAAIRFLLRLIWPFGRIGP